ncbi:uncharacterized protein LOC113465073 [Ceratina calcarata]|uniref:Uncharacterized protein LOC113465073 n=1 Tax=Ceratina calcarata TaxID=156304 RepID=A0AAJ7WFB0_9HYME|nr:uncharacterized protein LOC113465073 [Ceratina calcarata]
MKLPLTVNDSLSNAKDSRTAKNWLSKLFRAFNDKMEKYFELMIVGQKNLAVREQIVSFSKSKERTFKKFLGYWSHRRFIGVSVVFNYVNKKERMTEEKLCGKFLKIFIILYSI